MSSTDIAGASLDRVVAEVARAWAASDATALVFANGTLLDSARKQIVAYLKTQSDFTSLTKSPGGNLRDIMDARDEIAEYLQKAAEYLEKDNVDYEELKNIVNQQDFKKIREFFETENDSYIKDLIDQINKADPSNIELIAHGMNMTVEQAESLKSVIGSIGLEDILNGADKLLDKFETLNGILGDISEDTILSPENMNKVVSSFPDLFKEFDNAVIIEEDDHFQLFPNDVPSWSLTRLIKLMPTLTEYGRLSMVRNGEEVTEFRYGSEIIFGSLDPVDAAVQMIEWLLVHKLIRNYGI